MKTMEALIQGFHLPIHQNITKSLFRKQIHALFSHPPADYLV